MNPIPETTTDPADGLADILRACPVALLPASPEAAEDPSPDDDPSIRNRQSTIRNSTKMGTPCAKSWDDAWVATVEAAETRVGHRICGARMIDGTPCELGSDHPTGRCRFHGGFDLTGAPPGNRNAVIHGLYSRRLKTCGDHCPQWSTCPMVQPDLETIPLQKRPTCPYEQAQYNHALADALDLACAADNVHPFAIHIAHNIATLQVLMGRAATETRNATVVAETQAHSEKYQFNHEQIRPHINALARIGSELRKYIALLSKNMPSNLSSEWYEYRRKEIRQSEPGPDPEQFEFLPPEDDQDDGSVQTAEGKARRALTRAAFLAAQDKPLQAAEEWRKASRADARFTHNWTKDLMKFLTLCAERKTPPS